MHTLALKCLFLCGLLCCVRPSTAADTVEIPLSAAGENGGLKDSTAQHQRLQTIERAHHTEERKNTWASGNLSVTSGRQGGVANLSEDGDRSNETSDRGCNGRAFTRHLMDRAGRVEWKGGNQSVVCSWLIDVDLQYGIVLQFLALSLQRGDTRDKDDSLTVYRGHQPDKGERLRRVVGNLPVPPLVVLFQQVIILLETHGHYNNTCTRESSFTFSYKTYPTHRLPPVTDKGFYNCSAPYIVPEAFRCDMVAQCVDSEDELNYNCTYHEPRCEKGWVFANFTTWSACLKFNDRFVKRWGFDVAHCPARQGDTRYSGFFPSADSRQFVASLTSLAGYDEVFMDTFKPAFNDLRDYMHRFVGRWDDKYNYFGDSPKGGLFELDCAVLRVSPTVHLLPVSCYGNLLAPSPLVCEYDIRVHESSFNQKVTLTTPTRRPDQFPIKHCPDGTFVHTFHFCEADVEQATWSPTNLPLFHCNNGRRVHYTLACDGFDDCGDKTDESYCKQAFIERQDTNTFFLCITTHETITETLKCDGLLDCHDGSDEGSCEWCQPGMVRCGHHRGCLPARYAHYTSRCSTKDEKPQPRRSLYNTEDQRHDPGCKHGDSQPSLVKLDLDGYGLGEVTELGEGERCPETHVQCRDNLCIPSFLVGDGEYDCPWPHLDDENIRGHICPGHYRCYRYTICIHPDYLCDGVPHCPLKDDERYCDMKCPENCTCEGYAYTCQLMFHVSEIPLARYLDFSGSRQLQRLPDYQGYGRFEHLYFVRFINLSFCGLKEINYLSVGPLNVLDVSHNLITYRSITTWHKVPRLLHLNLSNNPLGPLSDQLTNLFNHMSMLSSLNLRNTGLRKIGFNSFEPLRNLKHLDIRENNIKTILGSTLSALSRLEHLDVSGNKIGIINNDLPLNLKYLDASHNEIETLPDDVFMGMRQLDHLDLSKNEIRNVTRTVHWTLKWLDVSDNKIQSIPENVFMNLKQLRYLNIQRNKIHGISEDMFRGPENLVTLLADDYSLCCAYFSLYPGTSDGRQCHAPVDELSSCSDLLRSNVYRVCLWFFSLLAILGNTGVLIYRLCLEVEGSSSGFRLLVANLCGSDFLMGVYLLIIGSADSSFRGQYVWKKEGWTQSATCQAAGFLVVVSSEVSAFIICIITLDRLLVLRFPLKRHLHLTWQSTMMACGAAWMTGFVLAMVPLLPPTGWEFYSQTGICLPLPITRPHFPGKHYSYGVFIVLNFVLFLMIGFGQIFIYRAVRNTPMADRTHRRQQDMAIARRLSLIVFSDFCCWFPVGVMGLLASQGTPIAGEYNVLAAIFVMPLNSAINPFLYTLNTLLERQRKRRNGARIERVLGRLHVEMKTWPVEHVDEILRHARQIRGRLTQAGPKSRPGDNPNTTTSKENGHRANVCAAAVP